MKRKLNNKGFTLVELLAVIVVLLIISGIAISSISAAIERNKAKELEAKKAVIISYAKLYVDEHKNAITSGHYDCISINLLDLDEAEKTDGDGNAITGFVFFDKDLVSGYEFKTSSDGNECYG